jgi:ribosomal protein L35AE/L33A
VKIVNPKYVLTSESITYHSNTKVAYFTTLTRIEGENGTLVARQGQYNTETSVSNFTSRSTVEYTKYTLTGDILNYDKASEIGYAQGNVVLVAKEDSTVIEGDIGRYFGKQGTSRVYGNAVAKNIVGQRYPLPDRRYPALSRRQSEGHPPDVCLQPCENFQI